MPLVHVVLLKIKPEIWEAGNDKAELLQKLDGLKEIPIVKTACQELAWGPPVYTERAKGWNYGLYSKFADKATYETYKDDADHRELVRTLIVPNTDDIMSYDIEY